MKLSKPIFFLAFLVEIFAMSLAWSAESVKPSLSVKHELLTIKFVPRSADQMGSFYEARGFPKPMREVLETQCFITVGIRNLSQQKIWLDLADWKFSVNGQPLKREHRDYWKKRWQAMDVPLPHQSTFRWTLIPETLDYLPGEREGGNLVLPYTKEKITLDARFKTGDDKQGEVIHIHYDQLYCAKDAS